VASVLLGWGGIGAGVAGIFGATVGGTTAVALGVTVIAVSALAVAGAVTGVGVGIAAGVGAFSDNDVNISHAS